MKDEQLQNIIAFKKWWEKEIKKLEFHSIGDKVFGRILAKRAWLSGAHHASMRAEKLEHEQYVEEQKWQ